MAVNKVVFGNEVKMDLTNDTVSADNLLEGETAHDRSGNLVVGTAKQGHSILNKLGALLTQRSKLKFGGMLKTTDDSTDEVTVVSDEAEEIEWSVWDAMTEAEKDAYSAGKKLDILHAPSVQNNKAPKTDIATVESGSTASRAYSVGELVYVNGNLYKVITAIASGATFTVGTNIQSTNVSGRLNEPLQTIILDPNDYPLLFGSGAISYTEHCVTICLNGMKNLTAQTSNLLLTLPTNLKPKSNIVIQVTSTTLTELYRFIVEASTGRLYVYPYQTVSGSGNIPATITYTI